ncbi:cytochrome b/b6 domain-containing protein [Methylocapsa palsarum]|uniref:Cytochrome b n=1 Tax=Methylocapsa palsarum TaxID=1612308 RepID=A0A1I4CK48_9HYPH|nr:cytochrome b/b6 domain-containing protein [Methylocapsa palsarum]SFK81634.1 Cytochrome b [Methylocapsa palsarum]
MSAFAKSNGARRVPQLTGQRVWDPLVRIFHWSIVVAFTFAWLTGEDSERLHVAIGYVIVGLVAVRLLWGFVGTVHARFNDFVYRPSVVIAYLIDITLLRAKRYVGHNPAGGAMVIALLVMLTATCATGIMMLTKTWGATWVEEAHEGAANLTLLLVGLHLAGVFAASAQHRENLVWAMITGRKRAG